MRNAYFVRLDRGESIAQVALATGVHADTISAIERGESARPRGSTIKKLADYYGVPARTLFDPPSNREAA